MDASASFSDAFSSQASLALAQGRTSAAPTLAKGQDARQVAEKFVGMFMSQMFSHMFEGIGTDTMFGGGAGEKMFRSELVNEYGKAAARQTGFGITDQIMHALISHQEVKS